MLVNNIKNSQQRLKEVFGDIVSRTESTPNAQSNTADMTFVQVSGSRIGVQTQGMVFDASRLSQMLGEQADQTKQQNNLFIFALIGAFIAFLLTDYLLIYRRTLTSISNLQAGAGVIGSGNLDYSIVERKGDEIGELAKAFNQMTANLKTVTASKADLEKEMTVRKRAEEALRLSEEKFSKAFYGNTAAMSITRLYDGLILEVNDRWCELMGFSREEAIGKTTLEINLWKHVEERTQGALELERNGLIYNREYTFVRKNGEEWIGILSSQLSTVHGEKVLFNSIVDITERKRAEERLTYQANLLTNITEVIYSTDEQLRLTSWNHEAERVYGWKEEEVLGRNIVEVTGSKFDPEMRSRLAKTLEETESVTAEIEHTTRSGKRVTFESKTMLIRDTGGKVVGFVAVNRDITERKQAEEALQKAHDELELRVDERTADLLKANEELMAAKDAAEEAIRAKAAFLANMSHELRTPMNSIIGFTSILLEEPLSPEYKDWLDTMRMNGEALLALINDILDFSKMEKEKIELEIHPNDLRQRIEESLDLVSTKAAEKGLDLAYTIDSNVPETIITDSGRLRQVLANLLSNAVKYTDKGDVVISVSSKPDEEGHEIHFAVQDTGIGIPQNQMRKLFQPFSQVNTSTSRLNEGTGLGLAISKKLVELMGGRIWVESEEGKGSTFHFTIKAMADSESGNGKVPAGPQPELAKRSVLIVDDNKTIRRILARQTQSWGMIPIIASSGYEVLDRVQKGIIPDVAILDVGMPDMDGITLAETIHRNQRDLPIIMLTSVGQHIPPDLSAASLEKPIKPAQLYDTLTSVLDGRPIQAKYQASASNPTSISPLRILLAEDNVSSQKVTLRMLGKLGYRADLAATGVEVIQALERQPYDVVLMDIKMPEMNGFEATRQIRQLWPNNGPKVIAITTYALDSDREKCLAAGMDDYISKPVKINELADTLSKYPPKNKI